MSAPQRVQLSRRKGWRMPENTVKVDRSTRWGNPLKVADYILDECLQAGAGYGTPGHYAAVKRGTQKCLADYRQRLVFGYTVQRVSRSYVAPPGWTISEKTIREELRGKNLACWCKPGEPCHADILLEIANERDPSRRDGR